MTDPIPGLEHSPRPARREVAPWTVAFVVLMVTLVSFSLIGPLIGMLMAYPFYDGTPMDFMGDLTDPVGNEEMKMLLMIIQGATTLFGLAIIPFLFWKTMRHKPFMNFLKGNPLKPIHFLMIAGIVVFFMGFNSIIMEWNSNIDLPDGAFERWAKDLEGKLAEVTKYMTSFTDVSQYLVAVLVIAILPGIGEEIAFRGLLQPELQKATRNVHVGIWLSAIFFSALHLQFYGFFPRVLLGALFGYLYYWSGNLMVPIFAHFVNNFTAVSVIYLGMGDLTGMEADEPTALPWYSVISLTALCGLLLYLFHKMQPKRFSLDDIGA